MTRHTSKLLGALAALVLVTSVGCGDDTTDTADTAGTADTAATTTSSDGGGTTAAAAGGTTVQLVDSDYGKILADGDGNVLYRFTPDTGSTSTCTGGCAATWPPLVGPATGDGVDAADLGTTTRDDGSEQVTFAGHPVYRYAGDSSPGDTTGQGIGGKWYVVDGDGETVEDASGTDRSGY